MAASRLHPIPMPWVRESPLTRELLHDSSCNGKARFHKFDLWHGFHLGIGKTWTAAGLLMAQEFVEGGTADERFRSLTALYLQFCREQKLDKLVSKIDKYMVTLGSWNKAAITTNMSLFIEHFFSQNPGVVDRDEAVYYMDTSPPQQIFCLRVFTCVQALPNLQGVVLCVYICVYCIFPAYHILLLHPRHMGLRGSTQCFVLSMVGTCGFDVS